MKVERWAYASLVVAAATRALLAPLRTLSADEAYYLWAARRSTPWPIADHPPLLGALVAAADRWLVGPVELRVRLVAVILQLATALGVARTARALARPEERGVVGATAAVLATWGLMPTAGGLLSTPDAPLCCAFAWIFALVVARPSLGRDLGLALLACAAVLSKAVAVPLVALLVVSSLVAGARRAAIALALGGVVGAPLAARSLVLQAQHALGAGPLVSAPRIGSFAAVVALVVGQLLLWSPPLLVVGAAALRRRSFFAGDRAMVVTLAIVVVVSALASGRAPEPNWTAPAALVVLVAASLHLAERPRLRGWVVGVAAAPALVALALWCAPIDRGPLARVPHAHAGAPADAPPYGVAAWRCVYEKNCDEIDAISRR